MTGLYNPPPAFEPRASRIPIHGRDEIATELWMGGANSLFGERIQPDDLAESWVVDLAGDMPPDYKQACTVWLARVFVDIESLPANHARLVELATSIAACLQGDGAQRPGDHPAEPPRRLYIMCQQGMNRSGLVVGLLLRALGVSAEDALAALTTRPGALNNQTFARLIREWPEGKDEG